MNISVTTLSDEKLALRSKGVGGSDAKVCMDGNAEKLERLRLEKLGHIEREDLSEVLPVQIGIFTEPFNKHWFTKITGRETFEAERTLFHKEHKFMLANLDGYTTTLNGDQAVFEAKHVNQFSKMDQVATTYYPQAQHYLAVTGLEYLVFSVLVGTLDFETFEITRDDKYIATLIEREKLFWWHVENDVPITGMDSIEPPAINFDDMREVSMAGNNTFANYAAEWINNKVQAKNFKDAEKELKSMVEPDVKKAVGYGVQITRAKNGNLSIKEEK